MRNENNWIYFKRQTELSRQISILNESNISECNKGLIKNYIKSIDDHNHKDTTLVKILILLRQFCYLLIVDLDKATKDDMQSAIERLYGSKISPATKSGYIKVIKQFYRYFKKIDERLKVDFSEHSALLLKAVLDKDNKERKLEILTKAENLQNKEKLRGIAEDLYNYIINDVEAGYKLEEIDPAEIITEQDLILLIEKGCRNQKDRAFISLLHETGARIGEFLNLHIKDITIKNNLAEIVLSGKTGTRTVFAHNSIPYFVQYIDSHPTKKDVDSFLWICEDTRRRGQPLMHIGAMRLLKRVFKRAGLKKKHNCHWFRHSRASLLAPKITEPLLRKYMGWGKDSTMIKHYGHISDKQLMDEINKLRGLKQEEENIKPLKCPICTTLNPATSEYCYKCYRPLRVETAMQNQELINEEISRRMKEMFSEFMRNPATMQEFEEFKKNVKQKED